MGNFNETFHRGHALNKTFFVHCSSSLFSQKKTILKESISFSNEKRSLSYSCWKGFALISVIWRFLLRWVNCFIDKAPPDCKDKHRNFQINAFYIHLNNHSMYSIMNVILLQIIYQSILHVSETGCVVQIRILSRM